MCTKFSEDEFDSVIMAGSDDKFDIVRKEIVNEGFECVTRRLSSAQVVSPSSIIISINFSHNYPAHPFCTNPTLHV